MDRVAKLALTAMLGWATASHAFGQGSAAGPMGPPASLPGANIHSPSLASPPIQPGRAPSAAPLPRSFDRGPASLPPSPVARPFTPEPFTSLGGGYLSSGVMPGAPPSEMDARGGTHSHGPSHHAPPTYVSPNPTPRAPQNLSLYRPSMPDGVEPSKLTSIPTLGVREYPYLRRGQTTAHFVTPPGMEMPEAVGDTTDVTTWRDRLRNLFDPLGVLGP